MKKSELFLLLLIVMVFQGCKTPHKPISDTDVVDGKTIANYLKTI